MTRAVRSILPVLVVALVLGGCLSVSTGEGGDQPPATATERPGGRDGSEGSSVRGSGQVRTEERVVSDFDRISFSGVGDLFVEQSGEESLTIEAEDNLLPLLISEVSEGRLILGVRPNSSISSTRPIIFRVTVQSLRGVEASGSGNVNASGLDVAELQVTTSGAVKAGFSGIADSQEIEASGTGRFDGRGLSGQTASVRASGTAEAVVNVSDRLNIVADGTAVVRYTGSPEVTRQLSGLARVEKL
jgi:hypothetical protein